MAAFSTLLKDRFEMAADCWSGIIIFFHFLKPKWVKVKRLELFGSDGQGFGQKYFFARTLEYGQSQRRKIGIASE